MTVKKKTSDDSPVTKKEMVNYIGPIFEELKSDYRGLKSELGSEITGLRKELNFKTHRLEVMMEDTKREILAALETFFAVSAKEEHVRDHEERITLLERDVKVLKTVSK